MDRMIGAIHLMKRNEQESSYEGWPTDEEKGQIDD